MVLERYNLRNLNKRGVHIEFVGVGDTWEHAANISYGPYDNADFFKSVDMLNMFSNMKISGYFMYKKNKIEFYIEKYENELNVYCKNDIIQKKLEDMLTKF